MKINSNMNSESNSNTGGQVNKLELALSRSILSKYTTDLQEVGQDLDKRGHQMVEAGVVAGVMHEYFKNGIIGFSQLLVPAIVEAAREASIKAGDGNPTELNVAPLIHNLLQDAANSENAKFNEFIKALRFVSTNAMVTADGFAECALNAAIAEENKKAAQAKDEDESAGPTPESRIHLN